MLDPEIIGNRVYMFDFNFGRSKVLSEVVELRLLSLDGSKDT